MFYIILFGIAALGFLPGFLAGEHIEDKKYKAAAGVFSSTVVVIAGYLVGYPDYLAYLGIGVFLGFLFSIIYEPHGK